MFLRTKITISFEQFVKFTIIITLVYFLFYTKAFGTIPMFFPVCVCLIFVELLLLMCRNKLYIEKNNLHKLILCWSGFYVLEMLVGIARAQDYGVMLNFLTQSIGYCLIGIAVIVISNNNKDYEWIYKTIVLLCLVSALYQFFFGKQYFNTMYVTTLSGNDNPNSLGVMMVMGIIVSFILFYQKKYSIIWIGFSAIFLYSIILTGSRKSFLVAILMIGLLGLYYTKNTFFYNKRKNLKILLTIIIIIAIIAIVYYFTNYFFETSMYKRLELGKNVSENMRVSMYKEGLELFLQKPVFGYGFGQFMIVSSFGTYSHSTYAELLSCTGLCGTIIYLMPYLICIISGIVLAMKNRTSIIACASVIGIICILFLGIGIIIPYEFEPIFLSMILFSLIDNEKKMQDFERRFN